MPLDVRQSSESPPGIPDLELSETEDSLSNELPCRKDQAKPTLPPMLRTSVMEKGPSKAHFTSYATNISRGERTKQSPPYLLCYEHQSWRKDQAKPTLPPMLRTSVVEKGPSKAHLTSYATNISRGERTKQSPLYLLCYEHQSWRKDQAKPTLPPMLRTSVVEKGPSKAHFTSYATNISRGERTKQTPPYLLCYEHQSWRKDQAKPTLPPMLQTSVVEKGPSKAHLTSYATNISRGERTKQSPPYLLCYEHQSWRKDQAKPTLPPMLRTSVVETPAWTNHPTPSLFDRTPSYGIFRFQRTDYDL